LFVARQGRYRCDEKRKRVGDVIPNGSFFPPISVIAPSSAERFNWQLGASPIDLKARLKIPRSGLADEIKHAVAPAFPLAERFFPVAA